MNIEFLQGGELEHLPKFATSLAIGLLIGLERERNLAAKAGLRHLLWSHYLPRWQQCFPIKPIRHGYY